MNSEADIAIRSAFLRDRCENGRLMAGWDWSSTSLGGLQTWPAELWSALGIVLGSRYPMIIWWGRDFAFLHNDAVVPVLGDKHPSCLGRPGAEVYPEVWDVLGPILESVWDTGQASWSNDQLLLHHRHDS